LNPILVVAAHPDDEVLGCGGLIASKARSGLEVSVVFVSDGVTSRPANLGQSKIETRRKAAKLAAEVLGIKNAYFGDFPDNQLDSVPILQVVQFIEGILKIEKPDIVLTHFGET